MDIKQFVKGTKYPTDIRDRLFIHTITKISSPYCVKVESDWSEIKTRDLLGKMAGNSNTRFHI